MANQCSKPDCVKDPRYHLCRGCERALAKNLREVGSLWVLLVTHPEMHLATIGAYDQFHRVRFGPPAPVDLNVLDLIDHRGLYYQSLLDWAKKTQAKRQTASKLSDMSRICEYLATSSGWLVRHEPEVLSLSVEVGAYATKLRRVVFGERRPPGPVPCPVFLPEVGPCKGHLRLHANGTVNCPECGTVWLYEQWAKLGAMLAS